VRNAFILLLAMITIAGVAKSSEPSDFANISSAELISWHFDPDSSVAQLDIQGGRVILNLDKKTIVLSLRSPANCPVGAMCLIANSYHWISLPLVEIRRNSCGEISYYGLRDLTPADGRREELIIHDNSQSNCEILYAAKTIAIYREGLYNRFEHQFHNFQSVLFAQKLQ